MGLRRLLLWRWLQTEGEGSEVSDCGLVGVGNSSVVVARRSRQHEELESGTQTGTH
jgi:hypothetical protein